MRVGVDATPLGLRGGGIPRYVEKLVAALAERSGTERFVLCGVRTPGRPPPAAPHFEGDRQGFPLQRWVKQMHPVGAGPLDLFHATNYLPPLLARMPTVLTVHDLSVHLLPHSHGWKRRLRHRMLPAMCHRAARVIADSLNTKRDLVRLYGVPEERIDVVYLAAGEEFRPVRDEEERARVRRRYGLPERFVLFVGSLDPRKNLIALVEAHARLRRRGLALPLVLGGTGPAGYLARLTSRARELGLRPGRELFLPGHVADADLPAVYGLCELFVYPSLYEGFGLPPLEAMACGAPVLVPDNSAFAELYRDTPLLFDLEEPDGLGDAMDMALASDGRRRELVEHGQKIAEARSWRTVADETVSTYRRALAHG